MDVLISGDIFLLKLSDTPGPDGTWSYQDILPNPTEDGILQVIQEVGESLYEWMADVNAFY